MAYSNDLVIMITRNTYKLCQRVFEFRFLRTDSHDSSGITFFTSMVVHLLARIFPNTTEQDDSKVCFQDFCEFLHM